MNHGGTDVIRHPAGAITEDRSLSPTQLLGWHDIMIINYTDF